MKFIFLLLLSLMAVSAAVKKSKSSEEVFLDSEENSFRESDEISEENEDEVENKPSNPKQWAVLVAGSDGWWNYRHQADICHAYQILLKRGIPASNIIVMMKDDIAHHTQNPTPGIIINKPNGTDVYKGVKIDYKGSQVTSKNFLNVLLGKKKELQGVGSGRVLQSGPKDNVFINFADHGGPGILCFPGDDLSAKDLIDTLKKLTKTKKYGKLVLYIEACESGSIFDSILPQNTKILASTASAYDESSWGCYCDYGEYPCLGDLYSVNWMEHLDTKISTKENLFDQYQTIRTLTTKSHANLYGDFKIGLSTSNNFVGPHNFVSASDSRESEKINPADSAVPSRDIPLHWMKRMAKNARNSLERLRYSEMVAEIEAKRKVVDDVVDAIIKMTSSDDKELQASIESKHEKLQLDMLTCYQDMYRLFSKKCVNMFKNPYVVKHFYKFANICLMDSELQSRAIAAINNFCVSDFQNITQTL